MPTLAAVIREFDPKKYRSVDVAKIIGCSDSYVRSAWQRMDPKRKRYDVEYRKRYSSKPEVRARANARFRERYASDPAFREERIRYVTNARRKKAEARA